MKNKLKMSKLDTIVFRTLYNYHFKNNIVISEKRIFKDCQKPLAFIDKNKNAFLKILYYILNYFFTILLSIFLLPLNLLVYSLIFVITLIVATIISISVGIFYGLFPLLLKTESDEKYEDSKIEKAKGLNVLLIPLQWSGLSFKRINKFIWKSINRPNKYIREQEALNPYSSYFMLTLITNVATVIAFIFYGVISFFTFNLLTGLFTGIIAISSLLLWGIIKIFIIIMPSFKDTDESETLDINTIEGGE